MARGQENKLERVEVGMGVGGWESLGPDPCLLFPTNPELGKAY